jgi:predicted dehydrogenase
MAVSPAEAESMVEQAYRSRRVLFPCHNYRHAPVIREVRGLLESGVIGPVHLVTLQTFRTTHARGVKEWNPDWRRERKYAGGGITMDHGSHTFYLAFEWLRSYPSTVSAKGTSLSGHDTEDNLSCTLTFPTGIATAHLTWTAGVRKVLYTLHGERGAITVDDDVVTLHAAHAASGWNAKAQREQNGSELLVPSDWMDASHKDWFGGLFDQFQEAMLEGNYVSSSTIDALQCVRTIQAAYDSSTRQGREVTIAQPSSHNSHARAASAPALAAAGSSSTG